MSIRILPPLEDSLRIVDYLERAIHEISKYVINTSGAGD